eukprot:3934325-Rhodomonas_salina.2
MPVKRGPNEVGSKRLFSDLQTDEPIAARTRSKLLEAAKRTVVWLTSVEDVRLPDLPDTLADSADPDARVVTVPANAKRKLLDALLSDVNTLYGAEDYHAPLFPTAGSGIVVLKASGLDTTVAVDWTGKFDTVATKMADCPERKAIEAIADVASHFASSAFAMQCPNVARDGRWRSTSWTATTRR